MHGRQINLLGERDNEVGEEFLFGPGLIGLCNAEGSAGNPSWSQVFGKFLFG